MLKKAVLLLVIVSFLFVVTGCYTHMHKVGDGAQGSDMIAQKQWYALWGLVPINQVDSQTMAGGAENYNITTQHSFIDIVIGCFTGIVTVYPTTVTVKK